jgi:hypothetical protein
MNQRREHKRVRRGHRRFGVRGSAGGGGAGGGGAASGYVGLETTQDTTLRLGRLKLGHVQTNCVVRTTGL